MDFKLEDMNIVQKCPRVIQNFWCLATISCASTALLTDPFRRSGNKVGSMFTDFGHSKDGFTSLPNDEEQCEAAPLPTTHPKPCLWNNIVAMLLCTSLISLLFGTWLGQTFLLDRNTLCTYHTSQGSAVLADVGIRWNTVRFNGSLLKENVYRQDAGPEVDQAWKALGVDYRAVAVPEHLAERSGFTRDQVRISQKYGGGYPANVEGLHHLHCLDLLRKALPWNMAYYSRQGLGPFANSEYILKKHITHCLDTIRQQLMCTVDVGLLGQIWVTGHNNSAPHPFVDFNTAHKCRNFEAMRKWAEARQLPEAVAFDFLKPPEEDLVIQGIP